MCLYSKQILPRRATKDITVYKVVSKFTDCVYTTPFKAFLIPKSRFGKVITDKRPKDVVKNAFLTGQYARVTVIESGYFHACQTHNDALDFCLKNLIYRAVILKCTIPKGALYWKGMSGDICSDKIIFDSVYYNSPL